MLYVNLSSVRELNVTLNIIVYRQILSVNDETLLISKLSYINIFLVMHNLCNIK